MQYSGTLTVNRPATTTHILNFMLCLIQPITVDIIVTMCTVWLRVWLYQYNECVHYVTKMFALYLIWSSNCCQSLHVFCLLWISGWTLQDYYGTHMLVGVLSHTNQNVTTLQSL